MGDVFDAMDRARREGPDKSAKPPEDSESSRQASDDTAPALPLDRVRAQASISDEPPSARVTAPVGGLGSGRIVSDAAAKADAERHETRAADPITGRRDASLNGYGPQIVVHHDRGSVITEQYRAIRTQILARARNRRIQTHVITSSSPTEGKTVTTINLGMAFSELRNQKTLMIEGDLRRPGFGLALNRTATPGLLQILRGEVSEIDQAIHPTVYDNLQFIPAGDRDQVASTELLSSPRMAQLLDRLKDRYDHIFIDTPPVVTVTDAAILGALSDETLLVVRLNKTPTEMVDRAKRLLRAANCELAGVILTHLQIDAPRYLYRYAYK